MTVIKRKFLLTWRVLGVFAVGFALYSIFYASRDIHEDSQLNLGRGLMSLPALPSRPVDLGQQVHWVFTTDCSAYMFNQGNLLLTSAFHVGQPGEFTWIVSGCSTPIQAETFKLVKNAHPRAKVFHAKEQPLIHPFTNKTYPPFQASNRPQSLRQWWLSEFHTIPKGVAVGILDPDEMFTRAVHLTATPQNTTRGPWQTYRALPKRGSGALYGIGCVPRRLGEANLRKVCDGNVGGCLKYLAPGSKCVEKFSSGPPWILHRDDAAQLLPIFVDFAIKTHDLWPDMLAEQGSFGLAQMSIGSENVLDAFWYLSNVKAREQPWSVVAKAAYDPCRERAPPPLDEPLPPLWHACSTYEIPHLKGKGFRLHKDHIHKDILDCTAPLLHYPPRDALEMYSEIPLSESWKSTWAVCTYTNLVNFHAGEWKKRYCAQPNLSASFAYPDHSQSFLNPTSKLQEIFRKGGWTDVDYHLGKTPIEPETVPELVRPSTTTMRTEYARAPAEEKLMGQEVHWVFTTDCSAYMFNQANLLLTSAHHVGQPGNFTWIISGCTREEQRVKLQSVKYSHPKTNIFYARDEPLVHPSTKKVYPPFQASNRPQALRQWWQESPPFEEAIGILDPDEMFMRPVHLLQNPKNTSQGGPWETQAVSPKHGSGAKYGIGCVPQRLSRNMLSKICSDNVEGCVKYLNGDHNCASKFSSGPPWILHADDAGELLPIFIDYAIKTHEVWPDMLAEQGSYGLVQMSIGMENHLDSFWFLSSPWDARGQPWEQTSKVKYDPCEERRPPDPDLPLPPLWHACSTFEIPHLKDQGFRLHKDHIHKDLFDCSAPLLHYPPQDALKRYNNDWLSIDWRHTWSVCAYTNLVNFHVASWKNKSCLNPNLDPSFVYPPHAQSFLNKSSELQNIFRKGGWTDVDYKIGRTHENAK